MMKVKSPARRKFLRDAGKVIGGTAVGIGLITMASCGEAEGEELPNLPWPYTTLDPDAVAKRAYEAYNRKLNVPTELYKGGGCCYGVFEGVIGELREIVGDPYTKFPSAIFEYGKGGVYGWGTLCGALNGAAAAIQLVAGPDAKDIIDAVYSWYTSTELPDFIPETPEHEMPDVKTIPPSPICHSSVQTWCVAAGVLPTSTERHERCGRLTGSVARKVAELLNEYAAQNFTPVQLNLASCLGCHDAKGGIADVSDGKKVEHGKKMDCAVCHEDGWTHPSY